MNYSRVVFEEWINNQKLTSSYKKAIITKTSQILSKSIYFYSKDLLSELRSKIEIINNDRYMIYATRLIIRYLVVKEIISDEEATYIKKKLSNIKSNNDNYVPNQNEITQTLDALNTDYKSIYLMYLMSGIRKNEGEYVLKNINTLQVQDNNSFVKIRLDLYRKTKNAYFCYLPKEIYLKIKAVKIQNIAGLETRLKRHKLISIKYTRKWFYSKCIELGIPESIADYYSGRISSSIGSKHYLAKQVLADQFYNELIEESIKFK